MSAIARTKVRPVSAGLAMLAAATAIAVCAAERRILPTTEIDRSITQSDGDPLETLIDQAITERKRRVSQLHHGIRSLLEQLTVGVPRETDDSGDNSDELQERPSAEPGTPAPLAPARLLADSTPGQEAPVPRATPVTDAPIDRLAAADSLFGAGDFSRALALYRQLQPLPFPDADRRWIRYQIASCHRRMGDLGNATQDYRELANDKVKDAVSENARWFIDVISERSRLFSNVENLTENLRLIEEQIRNEISS